METWLVKNALWHPFPHNAVEGVGGYLMKEEWSTSGALPLHALLPSLLVFLLGDPHLLECALGERGNKLSR